MAIVTPMLPEMTPAEEKILITSISQASEAHTKEGDTFYLISQGWWQEWLDFVHQGQSTGTNEGSSSEHHDLVQSSLIKRPSRIDNSGLIDNTITGGSTRGAELRDSLVEGSDYILLPQEVWNQLYTWYGGGPVLARKVITSGLNQTELSVEVYPLRLQLLLMPEGDQCAIKISKKETIRELHRRACVIFYLNSDQVCIWDYFNHQKHLLLKDMDQTLDDACIQMDQDILVEVINQDGGCASSAQENGFVENESSVFEAEGEDKGLSRNGSSELSNSPNSQNLTSIRESDRTTGVRGITRRGSSGGLTGLLNLGNTCFMNSAIQCLVHTPKFARYFRENYHQEINWDNSLGMRGELAIAFGELLRKLWAPERAPFAPRKFKAKLAHFAPQFSGYDQHDSQELLAFLLDGLHEDLNRVKHKPYIESRDADGRSDEEVADEYWENHIARNDSIIVDVCQGQYKSTLVCPLCNKTSVTFDPFMYLSLPLQPATTRTMTVTVYTCDGNQKPTTCTVTVSKRGRLLELIKALEVACSINQNEKLLLAEIQNHLILRFLEDSLMSLSSIRDDDHVVAYKIPKMSTKFLQLIHRLDGSKLYGTPLVLPISSDDAITRGDIQLIVHTMLSPIRKENPEDSMEICTDLGEADSTHKATSNARKRNFPKLPLQLLDETDAFADLSVGEEKTVKLSSSSNSTLLFMDWSHKLLKNYNTQHLESVPEVFKNGHVTKRTRSEPMSLYTCLEAFLCEEPLVPEDMWQRPIVIGDLQAGRCSQKLTVRVCRLWKAYNNQRAGELMRIEFVAIDEKGNRILCLVPSKYIQEFDGRIDEGKVYRIKNFTVADVKTNYRVLHESKFHLLLDAATYTEIVIANVPKIVAHKFHVVDYDDLDSFSRNRTNLCDIIGYASSASEVGERVVKGVTRALQTVELTNIRGQTLKLAVWGEDLTLITEKMLNAGDRVWLISSTIVTVDWMGGVAVGTSGASKFYNTQDIDEIRDFTLRLPSNIVGGELQRTVMHSSFVKKSDFDRHKKTIAEILDVVQECREFGEMLFVAAEVVSITEESGWRYNSCTSCRRKLQLISCRLFCGKCNRHEDSPVLRYRVEVVVKDDSGSMTCVMFDRAVEQILNVSATELADLLVLERSEDAVPRQLRGIIGRSLMFQLKPDVQNRGTKFENFTVTRIVRESDIKHDGDIQATIVKDVQTEASAAPAAENVDNVTAVPPAGQVGKRKFVIHEDGGGGDAEVDPRALVSNNSEDGEGLGDPDDLPLSALMPSVSNGRLKKKTRKV